jgi:uncharacterized membrane protein
MKKVSRFLVILFALCAVIWMIRAILDVAYKTYNYSTFGFVMDILCAVLWIVAFIVAFIASLKRCCSDKVKQ